MWLVLILKDFKLIITWIKTIKNSHRKITFHPVVPRVTIGRYKNKKFQLTCGINHLNQWITVLMSSYSLNGHLLPYHEITKCLYYFLTLPIRWIYICQLSWTIWESPRYGTDLSLSPMGHQISQIKWTFEIICALVWNLGHFFSQNSYRFLYSLYDFWDILALILSLTKIILLVEWWKPILMACTSFNTSYNVLSQGSWVKFVGGGSKLNFCSWQWPKQTQI